jgi:uracil-DNA glycosylase
LVDKKQYAVRPTPVLIIENFRGSLVSLKGDSVTVQGSQFSSFEHLRDTIIQCKKCPRLVRYREKIAREKRKQYADFSYWGKPVPGYGDRNAGLVVIGIAPAAHGGNRTGRVFTGDKSAAFLVRHLYEAGFANQPTSETRDDGLVYRNCYITAAVRCVPPGDKPSIKEIANCAPYLEAELDLLGNCRAILVLGKIAFDWVMRFRKTRNSIKGAFKFEHGKKYILADGFPAVFTSYHTSPRNTNTGKLTSKMFSDLLKEITSFLTRAEKRA